MFFDKVPVAPQDWKLFQGKRCRLLCAFLVNFFAVWHDSRQAVVCLSCTVQVIQLLLINAVYIRWSDVSEIVISMLWGNTVYCVKLSGEDMLRHSIEIESVGF